MPLDPFETPMAIENLCKTFNEAIEEGSVDALKKLSDLTKKGLKTSKNRTNLSKMSKIRASSRMVESKISTQTSKKSEKNKPKICSKLMRI